MDKSFDPINLLAIKALERAGIVDPAQEVIDVLESSLLHLFPRQQMTANLELSHEEEKCLQWFSKGKSTLEITKLMSLDIKSVELVLKKIKRKLKAASLAQAILDACELAKQKNKELEL